MVNSVSISKPPESTGKDFTNRRENTRYPDSMSLNDRPKICVTKPREQPISGAMAAPISGRLAVDARAHDHVEPLLDQPGDHGARARRVIGRVTVGQHVNVGIHIGEHAPHHIALALMTSRAAPPRRRLSDFNGAVGRVVVVDVDRRARKRGAKGADHLGNRGLFVVTGQQHRDLLAIEDR